MAILIGVHGLDNKPSHAELELGWMMALQEGLSARRAGSGGLPLALSYWADLYYDQPLSNEREPYTCRPGSATQATVKAVSPNSELLQAAPEVMAERYPDLARYYGEPELGSRTRDRLLELLLSFRQRRVLLISHSMGCVIAYDVLARLPSQMIECEVATFGCPLGFPLLRERMEIEHGTLRVPSSIRSWTNYSDPRDPVATLGLAEIFPSRNRCAQIIDRLVHNDYINPQGEANPHKVYGYLRSLEFSRQVMDFLGGRSED